MLIDYKKEAINRLSELRQSILNGESNTSLDQWRDMMKKAHRSLKRCKNFILYG